MATAQSTVTIVEEQFVSRVVQVQRTEAEETVEVEAESGCGQTSEHTQPQAFYGYCVLRASTERRCKDFVKAEIIKRMSGGIAGMTPVEEEIGTFGVFDDHGGGEVGRLLTEGLFESILQEGGLWSDPAGATRDAYLCMDRALLARGVHGGATAVTAMLMNAGGRLVVANVGDARAVLCKDGTAVQLSVDHTPEIPVERANVEMHGGVVTTFPGDLPRVDGQIAVSRAFGDATLKGHMSAKPDVSDLLVDMSFEFLILGSNGLWAAFPSNQDAVNLIRDISDPLMAAKFLAHRARDLGSGDEISCIVVRFRER
ncbi:hypothetical protein KP509_22G009300 [Ceratopteris richardii]|uniref:PPM-type phosphatase domain-containing protein n=1 Tax=Ceratopteris richardii TaxID=49495 RepID=A0A8T2S3I7_CERRI|nr:hypothetical protein KP509_22G009300 [Ceratopteris richardii]